MHCYKQKNLLTCKVKVWNFHFSYFYKTEFYKCRYHEFPRKSSNSIIKAGFQWKGCMHALLLLVKQLLKKLKSVYFYFYQNQTFPSWKERSWVGCRLYKHYSSECSVQGVYVKKLSEKKLFSIEVTAKKRTSL